MASAAERLDPRLLPLAVAILTLAIFSDGGSTLYADWNESPHPFGTRSWYDLTPGGVTVRVSSGLRLLISSAVVPASLATSERSAGPSTVTRSNSNGGSFSRSSKP